MDLHEIARLVSRNLFIDPPLTTATLKSVQRFTLAWSVFEGCLFSTKYESSKMQRKVEVGDIRLDSNVLNDSWRFYMDRYVLDGEGLESSIRKLNFKSTTDRNLFRSIINSPNPTDVERTIALFHICYRLRNNLFHGTKAAATLNIQAVNLDMASSILEEALLHSAIR